MSNQAEQESLAALVADLNSAGLGPIATADCSGPVIRIELDGTSPRKARTLRLWLTLITVRDMTVGRYLAADDTVYLNIRGWFPSGTAVAVAVPLLGRGTPAGRSDLRPDRATGRCQHGRDARDAR